MKNTTKITERVETWFRSHQRALPWRRTYEPYHVWVSEVMLQQTRMEVVLRRYAGFRRRFRSIRSLAAASESDVLAAWSGLGYYRRARMLREGAADVVARFAGRLPRTVEELRTIPGIGRYTAGAIASIAFNERAPIVDGNIARIVSRLCGIDAPTGSLRLMSAAWKEAEDLVAACASPREFNQGLMELGALVCRPTSPLCDDCPLRRHCTAFRSGRTSELPARAERAQPRAMTIPLYLIRDAAGRLLMRRESGRLMTALFHLPHGETHLLPAAPLMVDRDTLLGRFRHTVTNRRIEFHVYAASLQGSASSDAGEYAWVDPNAVTALPHPSYVAKALKFAPV